MGRVVSCMVDGCDLPKHRPYHRCIWHWLAAQPATTQTVARDRRLSMVPLELRRKTVPARLWPEGARWCASCQSFVPLHYVRGSRCKACASASSHSAMVAKVYGIDSAEYDRLLKLQGGRCAICRRLPKSKRLAVDHDHTTNEVRGLLCKTCNKDTLGGAHDSKERLLAAYHYMNTPPMGGDWIPPERGLVEPVAPSTPVPAQRGDLFAIPSERGSGVPAQAVSVAATPEPSKYRDPVRYPVLSALLARVKEDAGPRWVEEDGRYILYRDINGEPCSPPPF